MKFSSKLAVFGAIASLSAGRVVLAEEAAPVVVTPPETTTAEEPATDPADNEKPPVDEPVTEDAGSGNDETTVDDGGEVPLDWVKRDVDGENPDVIFYNMAGGGSPTSGQAPAASDEAGKDEAATVIEAKPVAPVAPIARAKKGPVALVKGARVFLHH